MNDIIINFPTQGEIKSNHEGFQELAALNSMLIPYIFETIEIDFSRCRWFDANMCAPLGALLAQATNRLNEIRFSGFSSKIKEILAKNRFLESYGYSPEPDRHETAVPYRRFAATDQRAFAIYLQRHLKGKGIPEMSEALSKRFQNSLFELLANAAMHAESELGVFVCGQFFPQQNRVDFTIVDAGIGIKEKIRKELGEEMAADQAIEWALQEGHTTRRSGIPGGLGLQLIKDFIGHNKGRIQIASDRGYWELHADKETTKLLDEPFPGTAVNIEIDTTDQHSYRLKSEA